MVPRSEIGSLKVESEWLVLLCKLGILEEISLSWAWWLSCRCEWMPAKPMPPRCFLLQHARVLRVSLQIWLPRRWLPLRAWRWGVGVFGVDRSLLSISMSTESIALADKTRWVCGRLVESWGGWSERSCGIEQYGCVVHNSKGATPRSEE